MSDRYVTLVLRVPEQVAESMIKQASEAGARGIAVREVSWAEGGLAGMWVTDYMPENPTLETRHIIQLSADGWTLQHPHECRASGQLFDCPVNQAATRWGPALDTAQRRWGAGRYPVTLHKPGGLTFGERLPE